MTILYYDCFAGISGDMNLAALIDMGVDKKYLLRELKKLPIDNYEIRFSADNRKGIHGTRVDVIPAKDAHDLKSDSPHNHTHHAPVIPNQKLIHEQRSFRDISMMINNSKLNNNIKKISVAIFTKVAEAESKIHNIPLAKIHFHEVGAVDSIVDIIGAAICIDYLKPDRIIASKIELGSGIVKCAHGIFPVPAPATVEILKNIPVKTGNVPFEATTPTGAAIISCLAEEFSENMTFKITKIGYGIGHNDSEVPNVLRVFWAENMDFSKYPIEQTSVVECNIDDMNPEMFEYLIDKALDMGADDVYLTPIIMKKSRPAITLSILCKPKLLNLFIEFLLTETSTLGLRHFSGTKTILKRETIDIMTTYGKIRVKKSDTGKGHFKYKPEYSDCLNIAKNQNIPLIRVINEVQKDITEKLKTKSKK